MKYLKYGAVALVAFVLGLAIGTSGSSSPPAAAAASAYTAPAPAATYVPSYTPPAVVAAPTLPPGSFTDGMYLVGSDIKPGTYKTSNPEKNHCYYEVDKDMSGGSFGTIATNGNIQGPGVFQVGPSHKVVELSGGCTWTKV